MPAVGVWTLLLLVPVWGTVRARDYKCYPNTTTVAIDPGQPSDVSLACDNVDVTCSKTCVDSTAAVSAWTETESTSTNTVTLISSLRQDNHTSPRAVSATVGDELYWTIDVPSEYTAIPTTCTLYAGFDKTSSTNKVIVTDGCSQDAHIVLSFAPDQTVSDPASPGVRRYWTTFWAFRFFTTDHVLISCRIKLCLVGSRACDFTCGHHSEERVRKELEEGVIYGQTSTTLRAVSKRREYKDANSATPIHKVFWLLCAAGLLFYLWG